MEKVWEGAMVFGTSFAATWIVGTILGKIFTYYVNKDIEKEDALDDDLEYE